MSRHQRQPQAVPATFLGQTALSKSKVRYKVIRIDYHLNSTDMSYLRIQADSGRERTVHYAEWQTNFGSHSALETKPHDPQG